MKKRDLIRSAAKETFAFPVLLLPLFLISLLSIILVSDSFIAAVGQDTSMWLNLITLFLLSPPAMGVTILMDRSLHHQASPNPVGSLKVVRSYYPVLIGVNFVSWVAVLMGLLLFILPGLFLLIKLLFINQEVLLHEETSLEKALRNSWDLTTGNWVELFALVTSLTLPIFLIEFLSYQLPASLAATLQVSLGTLLQTWLVLATTHAFIRLSEESEE